MLVVEHFYRIPKDEDGRVNREFDRLFQHVARWWPDVEIPEGMVSAASRKKGEPEHMGAAALHQLRDGGAVSQHSLNAALDYLKRAHEWYASEPEPFPGRNEEARKDMYDMYVALIDDEMP